MLGDFVFVAGAPARRGALCLGSAALRRSAVMLLALCFLAASSPAARAANADFDFFERRIRPLLVDHCYSCHSAAAEPVRGALLLDSRDGMLKGGESGLPAIVPHNPAASRVVEAIRHANHDLKMPPKIKLSVAQIDDVIAWIAAGAPDPRTIAATTAPAAARSADHWAFQPPRDPPIPRVRNQRWPLTPIDRLVLAALEAKGLSPSPQADRRTLIRRLAFDLTGRPPDPGDVDRFVQDPAADAYARMVDQWLASPRYGERWGRYWLDVARYADTKGYVYSDREESRFVHSYVYRDWVIDAWNSDMPYDQFLLAQIAADQLGGGSIQAATGTSGTAITSAPLEAMGFLTLGRRFLGVVHDIIDDRLDVVFRGTQGLSIGCARCHDHKFDPVTMKDYYGLYGVFAGTTERLAPVSSPGAANPEHQRGLEERTKKLKETFEQKREAYMNRYRARTTDYLLAALDVKKLPSEEFYEIRGPDDLNPTIVRSWDAFLLHTRAPLHPVLGPWHTLARLDSAQFAANARTQLEVLRPADGSAASVNPLVIDALNGAALGSMRDVARVYGALLEQTHTQWQREIEAARTNRTELPKPWADPAREQLRQVLYGPSSPVTIPDLAIADLEWYFDEPARVELSKLHADIERFIIQDPGAPRYAVTLKDRPVQKNSRIFLRGNPANRGAEVPRQFIQALARPADQPFRHGSGRFELAQAIVREDNPLTARVLVNRIWMHHFGAGLVPTPSDFGTRCDPPSHPELLDWLALRFQRGGWSIKRLQREILLSAVYQQASDLTPSAGHGTADRVESAADIDPENRLLWRMNRRRLDFEALRDTMIETAGHADLAMGGKPIDLTSRPFSPRRAVYGYTDRQFLPGLFRLFDVANPDMHAPQRHSTTVPQQALFFLNSPFVAAQARALVRRTEVARAQTPAERVETLYRLAYQRAPTSAQRAAALRFVEAAGAAPPMSIPPPPVSPWRYGYGAWDNTNQTLLSFSALPHFSGQAWQGGSKWPDATIGWVRLTAEGGHPGNDIAHAAVRRWVAPASGVFNIQGTLQHSNKEGDGIRAHVLASTGGVLGTWAVHSNKTEVRLETASLKAGDTVDFIVDIREGLSHDDFLWAPVIRRSGSDATEESDPPADWNAKRDFAGPPPDPEPLLETWERLAQVLLLANEFVYVD
jgi:hypothetical protein